MIPAGDIPRIGALIRPSPLSEKPTSLRIRPLGGRPVAVRSGTTDFATLRTTFKHRYHRPFGRLPEPCIILDLGCNVGYTVLDYAYQYPKSWVIGVELDTDNFCLAQKNTCTVRNVTVLQRAISVSNGIVTYRKKGPEDAYQINHQELSGAEMIQAESITISSLMRELDVRHVDYLKMDVEGEEVRLFDENLSDLGWLNKVSMLNIEVHSSLHDLQGIMSTLRTHHLAAWKDDQHWSSIRAVRM